MDRTITMTPKKKGEGLSHRYSILVDPDWLARVEVHAKRLGISPAAFIRMAAIRLMESDPLPDAEPAKKPRKAD